MNFPERVPLTDPHAGHANILITASAFLFLLAIATLDVRLNAHYGVLLFYLVPIAWTAWFAGQNPALAVAVACSFARFGVETVEELNRGYSRPELVWGIGSDLIFFLVFTGLLLKVHALLDFERSLARSDPLTRLYNARAFHEAVLAERERLHRYGRTLTLVYFDLDNFKYVNDKWGHAAGDDVLKTIAQVITSNIRQVDIAARLGGDEFAILLPETDAEGAGTVMDRIRPRVVGSMEARGWPVTASFGCVTFRGVPETVSQMLQEADNAMYKAKKSGKNRIVNLIFE